MGKFFGHGSTEDHVNIELVDGKPTPETQRDLMVCIGEAVFDILEKERKAPVDQAVADNNIAFAMEWFKWNVRIVARTLMKLIGIG